MRVFVYTGPTISSDQAGNLLDAHYLPPVKHGDIIDALADGADCIAIIDGYYESVASCRHKEILQALAQGVPVLGCSSFGAMRAAELAKFGMEGFGEIYSMYESGAIDGDDEVAIKHAPNTENYRLLSVALVNLRYNLQNMVAADLIETAAAELIIRCGKNMYFGERTLKRILKCAVENGLSPMVAELCQNYFKTEWQDLKLIDASKMLNTISARLREEIPWPAFERPTVKYNNYLHHWNLEHARIEIKGRQIREQSVLAQLKFTTNEYPKARQIANTRAWLKDYADRLSISVSNEEIALQRSSFRDRNNIDSDAAEHNWLADNNLTINELMEFLQAEATVTALLKQQEQSMTPLQLLLKYAQFRKLTARESEIDIEWQKFWPEIHLEALDIDKLLAAPRLDLAISPLKKPLEIPSLTTWCNQNDIDETRLRIWLGQRSLLRMMLSNYYIFPHLSYNKLVMIELKQTGHFKQAKESLSDIYDQLFQGGYNMEWHQQWKEIFCPDLKVVLTWFCNKYGVHSKLFSNYIIWKGFNRMEDFIDTAQLNYISVHKCL